MGPLRICILVWVVGDHPSQALIRTNLISLSHQPVTSVKAVVGRWSRVAACNGGRHSLWTTDTPTHHAAVRASVDEGMSSREPSSSAAGAPVQLSEFDIAVDLETFGPLTNSRNVSDLVHAGSARGPCLARRGCTPSGCWRRAPLCCGLGHWEGVLLFLQPCGMGGTVIRRGQRASEFCVCRNAT